jgi:hypothetical protein
VLKYQSVRVAANVDVDKVDFEAEAARQTPLAGKAGELDEEDAYIRPLLGRMGAAEDSHGYEGDDSDDEAVDSDRAGSAKDAGGEG